MQAAVRAEPSERNVPQKSEKPLRGKSAPPYIEVGTQLGKYKLTKLIGGGGFGQIYKVVNVNDTNIVAAAKVEPQGPEHARMVLEQQVLLKMRGNKHFPTLMLSGEYNKYHFLVMDMLGRNFTDIRKRCRSKRLSVASTMKVGIQTTRALQSLHEAGYIHRDIKPSNMCVGLGNHASYVYLIDFGMARLYRTRTGVRRAREYASFRGTMRYASIRAHERREQSPSDDLYSLYYTLIELAEGMLPWRLVTDHDQILSEKLSHNFDTLTVFTPIPMRGFVDHIHNLTYDQMPNYEMIYGIFYRCMPNGCHEDDDFDWEEARG